MCYNLMRQSIVCALLFSGAPLDTFSMEQHQLGQDIDIMPQKQAEMKEIQELIDLDKAMRSGYKPIEEISQENARSNIVKQSIRDTLKHLGHMRFPTEATTKDVENRKIMLTSLTDCIRFYMGGEGFIPKHFRVTRCLDFLNYFCETMSYSDADKNHLSELLVYCQVIITALSDFRKATLNDLKNLSDRLKNLSEELVEKKLEKKLGQKLSVISMMPDHFIQATIKRIQDFDQQAIDHLTETLPQNLKEMIALEHVQKTSSPNTPVKWERQYRGDYDFETQGQLIQKWRKEADESANKLYLMVGRTNNEIPAIESDQIMWVYADLKADVMNPKGDRHLLWDMNVLEEPKFLPDSMFNGIILDPSTWKFLGGQDLIPLFNDFDRMKECIDRKAKEQENFIKGCARILKDDGFVSFEPLNEKDEVKVYVDGKPCIKHYTPKSKCLVSSPEEIINDFYNYMGDMISKYERVAAGIPHSYTRGLFNKYFYARHHLHEEFSFQDDYFGKDIFLPFTPTTPKIKMNLENNDTDYMSQRFVARYPVKAIQ